MKEKKNYWLFLIFKIVSLLIPTLISFSLLIFISVNSYHVKVNTTSTTINKTYEEGFQDAVYHLNNSINLGIVIIGIAVSIWIGLNIYNIIERDQLQLFQENLKKADDNLKDIEERLKNQNEEYSKLEAKLEKTQTAFKKSSLSLDHSLNILKYIALSISLQYDELPSRIFKDTIFKEIAKESKNISPDEIENDNSAMLLAYYGRIENCYINLRKNEDTNSRKSYGKDGYILCVDLISNKFYNELSILEQSYIQFRAGELCYYLGDEYNGFDNSQALMYEDESLFYYNEAVQLNPSLNKDGYLDNTLSGIWLWKGNNLSDKKEKEEAYNKALEYVNKALNIFSDRGVYFKNKGVILEKLGGNKSEIKYCYKKAIDLDLINDKPNYRNYLTLASIQLKELYNKMKIIPLFKRIEPLHFFKETYTADQEKEIETLIQEIEDLYIEAIELAPKRIESYYKYGELFTCKYLFLKSLQENDEARISKENALTQFKKADYISNDFIPAKFQERNYYEAIGDIQKAKQLNDWLLKLNAGDSGKWDEFFRNWSNTTSREQ